MLSNVIVSNSGLAAKVEVGISVHKAKTQTTDKRTNQEVGVVNLSEEVPQVRPLKVSRAQD